MHITLKCALFALCLSVVRTSQLSHTADYGLMQYMLQSRSLQQYAGPERSQECFAYYVPLLNAIIVQFETEYAACLAAADEGRSAIDANTQPQRDGIEGSATTSCQALRTCTDIANSVDYFECFVNEASASSKNLYRISIEATDLLVDVREKYRLIENEEYRCKNASERAYAENTAKTYKELDDCLQGKSPVPTVEPPTESSPTEGSPTEGSPTEGVPTEGSPTEGAPTEGAPTEGAPTEGAPTEGAPTEGAPTEGAPTEGAPTEGAPTEGAPTEGAPTEGAPTEGAPTEGAPTEGAPTEGAPTEGAPTEGSTTSSDENQLPEEDLNEPSRNRLEKIMRELEENLRHKMRHYRH